MVKVGVAALLLVEQHLKRNTVRHMVHLRISSKARQDSPSTKRATNELHGSRTDKLTSGCHGTQNKQRPNLIERHFHGAACFVGVHLLALVPVNQNVVALARQ